MIKLSDINVGDELPLREHTASNVSLFLYNAAVWNAHRIHYDEAYTTGVEQHPEIVIDGPLQGDWLSQCALNWVGDAARLTNFSYSNRKAAYLGETLTIVTVKGAVPSALNKIDRREATPPSSRSFPRSVTQ